MKEIMQAEASSNCESDNQREAREKRLCRKVWVSFGIFMILLPFMDGHQIICLQSANKFCYSIAVSRIQLSLRFDGPFYFTWHHEGKLSKSILSFSMASRL